MSGICWLASYPKSGNTWVRALLTNYRRDQSAPANINALDGSALGLSRAALDEVLGVDSSPWPLEVLEKHRPLLYEHLAATCDQDPLLVKVHDAFTVPGVAVSPLETPAARAAVYLVRNPLDVAVSYAHHRDQSVDNTIAAMADPHALMDGTHMPGAQLPQRISSWSHHALSWLDQQSLPVLVVRYEDLTAHPVTELGRIVEFLGLPRDEARLARAVEWSTFDTLRRQELELGFAEKQPTAPSFFREGRVGTWRDHLTREQTIRIADDHAHVMKRLAFHGSPP